MPRGLFARERRAAAGTPPLWRQRDFGVFWAAQTLSVLGDACVLIAAAALLTPVRRAARAGG